MAVHTTMKTAIILFAVCTFVQGVCRTGWVRNENSCYLFVTSPRETWATAMSYCAASRGHLAEITTKAENDFIRLHLTDLRLGNEAQDIFKETSAGSRFWIGGEDYEQEGYWVWAYSGNRISETFWVNGEPNEDGPEDCLNLMEKYNYFWNDQECDEEWSFICEIEDDDVVVVG